MRIDYSLPATSLNRLYLDANFHYGYRHLQAAVMSIGIHIYSGIAFMSAAEICAHIVIGLTEMIPIIGHLLALADQKINHRDVQIIRLSPGKSAYEMGIEEGQLLKEDIQFTVTKVLALFKKMLEFQGKNPLEEARNLEAYIPREYIEEMRGLAVGAGVPYEEVLIGNTIFDVMSLFGCSLYAISDDQATGTANTEIATNYFHSLGRGRSNVDESFERYDALQAAPASSENDQLKNNLSQVDYYDTVQSMILDTNTCDIELATASQYAASTSYTHFSGNSLFRQRLQKDRAARKIQKIARTLDWPLPFLGPLTTIIVRPRSFKKEETMTIGWPGLIGTFSGMNAQGVGVVISVVPSRTQKGTCNQFIFRRILEQAATIEEATAIVEESRPASPMNLCIAARNGIALMELDPARRKQGAATSSITKIRS